MTRYRTAGNSWPRRQEGGFRRGGRGDPRRRRGRGRRGARRRRGWTGASCPPRAPSWSTPAGRAWLDERYPEAFADFRAEPRGDGGLRALRADQPRAAGAVHRLADDPGRRRAGAQRPLRRRLRRTRSSTVSAPSTSAPHRPLGQFAELEPRLGAYLRSPRGGLRQGARRRASTSSAARASTATTRSGSSCTRTCCGCSGASARSRRDARRRDRVIVLDGSSVPDREVVGQQGREHRPHALARAAGAAGVRAADRGVPPLPRRRRAARRGFWDAVLEGVAGLERDDRAPLRRPARSRCWSRSARAPR